MARLDAHAMTKEDGLRLREARRARVRRLRARVVGGSVALFIAVWLLITVVLVTGHDPALAAKTQTVTTAAATATSPATGSTGSTSSGATSSSTGATSSGATSSSTGSTSGASPVTSSQS
jgi:hypothetical protein